MAAYLEHLRCPFGSSVVMVRSECPWERAASARPSVIEIGVPKSPNGGDQGELVGERDILDELIGPCDSADDEDDADVEEPSTHGRDRARA